MRVWLIAGIALAALMVIFCNGQSEGLTQRGDRDAKHKVMVRTEIKLGPRIERHLPVSIGRSLYWVDNSNMLAASWQTLPISSLYAPTAGLIDLDTGIASALLPENGRKKSHQREYSHNAVPSHDGRWIAYTCFTNPFSSKAPAKRGLWIRSLKGGREFQAVNVATIGPIQWMPDDQQMIYAIQPSTSGSPNGIWKLDLANKRATLLHGGAIGDLSISPDGAVIAYMIWTKPGYQLWIFNLRSGQQRLITSDGWSPSWNGNALWYVTQNKPWKGRDSSTHGFGLKIACIEIAKEDDMKVELLGPDNTRLSRTQISPDGNYLWVLSDEGQLWLVDSQKKHWLSLEESNVTAAAWSPDGRKLAWSKIDPKNSQSAIIGLTLAPQKP